MTRVASLPMLRGRLRKRNLDIVGAIEEVEGWALARRDQTTIFLVALKFIQAAQLKGITLFIVGSKRSIGKSMFTSRRLNKWPNHRWVTLFFLGFLVYWENSTKESDTLHLNQYRHPCESCKEDKGKNYSTFGDGHSTRCSKTAGGRETKGAQVLGTSECRSRVFGWAPWWCQQWRCQQWSLHQKVPLVWG